MIDTAEQIRAACTAFTDPAAVDRARTNAQDNVRDLRMVASLASHDACIYEDVETGEQRALPAKLIMALGARTAFELSELPPVRDTVSNPGE